MRPLAFVLLVLVAIGTAACVVPVGVGGPHWHDSHWRGR